MDDAGRSPPLLECRRLTVERRGTRRLDDVSFTVEPGEVLLVVGENGAGKSTLIDVLAGSLAPSSGRVLYSGEDWSHYDFSSRARIRSCLRQKISVTFPLNSNEVVDMGVGNSDPALQGEVHSRLNIPPLLNRQFAALSGGEQQRLHLARVLLQNGAAHGQFCLLDEPLVSLDSRHQIAAMQLLHALSERGVAIIAVMHDLQWVQAFAKRVLLLHSGRVIAHGKAKEVLVKENLQRYFGLDAIDAKILNSEK